MKKISSFFQSFMRLTRPAKMNMNFGSLNVEGGENRLNVAVTRAREKIILVSSIMPQQLNVDNSKNEGPKLLRKYLEYDFVGFQRRI